MINDTVDRWAATAGLLAALFCLTLIIVLGALEPGFSHRTSLMSTLGGVPGVPGLSFNLGVVATGVLLIAFAIGLPRQLPPTRTPSPPSLNVTLPARLVEEIDRVAGKGKRSPFLAEAARRYLKDREPA